MTTITETTAPVNATYADLRAELERARTAADADTIEAIPAVADAYAAYLAASGDAEAPAHAEYERRWDAANAEAEARLDAAEAAMAAYEGPRPWILRADGVDEVCTPCSLDEARERAEEWAREGDYGSADGTVWTETHIVDPATDEVVETVTTTIDPEAPPCSRGDEHTWESPHEVVGGLRENPGVRGHGGGVIVTEVCRCGAVRVTDTWATNPCTGEQGFTSVRYPEPGEHELDEEIEAWARAEDRAEALDRLVDASDEELYRTAEGDSGALELTEAGVELAESAGLRVDVDAYGCAYCVEATEDDRWGVSLAG